MSVYHSVRHAIEATWLNDRDQYLSPNKGWKTDGEFQGDCLVFTLFHSSIRIKSEHGVNHWIPFTEEEVGAQDCFASHFMSDFLKGKVRGGVPNAPQSLFDGVASDKDCGAEGTPGLSRVESLAPLKATGTGLSLRRRTHGEDPVPFVDNEIALFLSAVNGGTENDKHGFVISTEARAVLDAGRELWRYYHAQPRANPNASYYDIRKSFQGMKVTAKGKEQMNPTSNDERYNELLAGLKAAMKKLAAKIEPKVYAYGFLRK